MFTSYVFTVAGVVRQSSVSVMFPLLWRASIIMSDGEELSVIEADSWGEQTMGLHS